MKTALIILCIAVSVRAAAVVPVETDKKQEDKPAPNSDTRSAAFRPQARFAFCLDGWLSFNRDCYFLGNNPDTWTGAESFCASFGGSLASVHSIKEYSFLQRVLKTGGHAFGWIGGYHFEGDWRWEDGSVFNYNNVESLGSVEQYRCLMVNSDGSKGWTNHGCGMRLPFLCLLKTHC